jgi:bacterioferritin-associated ferredoxin
MNFKFGPGALTVAEPVNSYFHIGHRTGLRERTMIVCSCNLITEAEIREALSQPDRPCRVRDVYASCGCAPVCGGCAGAIARMLNEIQTDELYSCPKTLQKVAA